MRRPCGKDILLIISAPIIVIIIIVVFALLPIKEDDGLTQPLPPSKSKLGIYKHYGIAADSKECADIGSGFLSNPSASVIDAAIAAVVCTGLVSPHSCGIGGGFFMLYYKKSEKKMYMIDARETAPSKATKDMFEGKPEASRYGGLSIAVPGEIRGLHHIHQKFGKLSWKNLIQPSIELCMKGIRVTHSLRKALDKKRELVMNEPTLRELFYDEKAGDFYDVGHILKRPVLGETLKVIADEPDALYTGSLLEKLVDDLTELGSIITKEDLINYQVKERQTVTYTLSDRFTLHSTYPPGSGLILGIILNLFEKLNSSSKEQDYHNFAESMKFGYAQRGLLGDPDHGDLSGLVANLTNEKYLDYLRSKIREDRTFDDPKYYGAQGDIRNDEGTSHISLIDRNGDAVAITTTINGYFGAMKRSRKTGIILNNEMDDFSSPNMTNQYDLPPSESNFIAPGKRPVSSMVPTIVLEDDQVRMVTGGSGGSRITSGTAFVIAQNIFHGRDIKKSTDEPRIHHQLLPMELQHEYGILKKHLEFLEGKNHKLILDESNQSIIESLSIESGFIFANADHRKGGEVSGE